MAAGWRDVFALMMGWHSSSPEPSSPVKGTYYLPKIQKADSVLRHRTGITLPAVRKSTNKGIDE